MLMQNTVGTCQIINGAQKQKTQTVINFYVNHIHTNMGTAVSHAYDCQVSSIRLGGFGELGALPIDHTVASQHSQVSCTFAWCMAQVSPQPGKNRGAAPVPDGIGLHLDVIGRKQSVVLQKKWTKTGSRLKHSSSGPDQAWKEFPAACKEEHSFAPHLSCKN